MMKGSQGPGGVLYAAGRLQMLASEVAAGHGQVQSAHRAPGQIRGYPAPISWTGSITPRRYGRRAGRATTCSSAHSCRAQRAHFAGRRRGRDNQRVSARTAAALWAQLLRAQEFEAQLLGLRPCSRAPTIKGGRLGKGWLCRRSASAATESSRLRYSVAKSAAVPGSMTRGRSVSDDLPAPA